MQIDRLILWGILFVLYMVTVISVMIGGLIALLIFIAYLIRG